MRPRPPLRYCTNSVNRYKETYANAAPDCPDPGTPTDEFEYDEDGNLVDDGVFEYSCDMENRLTLDATQRLRRAGIRIRRISPATRDASSQGLIAITPQVVETGSKNP